MNKNVPNILTVARVVMVPFFILSYMKGYYLTALIIFILASLTDMLDGKIARKFNLISNFGKFMDPLADKILTYSAFCLFVEDKTLPAWFLIIVLAREFVVAGIRMLAAQKGTVIAADLFGKIKTVLQMVGIPAYILFYYMNIKELETEMYALGVIASYLRIFAIIVLYLSLLMTLVSGYNYVVKNIGVFNDKD